jgi:hypothetical protein
LEGEIVMIKAGDTIDHGPTGERWFILGVNEGRNEVCVAGWPPSKGNLSDCKLVEEGNGITEEELRYREKQFGHNWDE